MVHPKRQFIDGKFGQIHLRICAPERQVRRPLVCLHMFPQSGRNFESLLAELGTDRIVIAPDFPGYGESSPPSSPIDASEYAASVWEAVDALSLTGKFGAVDFFGIHAGAKLAVEAVCQRPQDVNRIVLSSAAVLLPDEIAKMKRSFGPVPLDDAGTRFQNLWRMLNNNRGPGMTYEMMATSLAEMLRGGEKMEWGHHSVFKYNEIFAERLGSLPHQIALINPRDDLYEMTPRSLKFMQNGELFDRPDWSHGFMDLQAKEVANFVAEFLSRDEPDHSSGEGTAVTQAAE